MTPPLEAGGYREDGSYFFPILVDQRKLLEFEAARGRRDPASQEFEFAPFGLEPSEFLARENDIDLFAFPNRFLDVGKDRVPSSSKPDCHTGLLSTLSLTSLGDFGQSTAFWARGQFCSL